MQFIFALLSRGFCLHKRKKKFLRPKNSKKCPRLDILEEKMGLLFVFFVFAKKDDDALLKKEGKQKREKSFTLLLFRV